MDVIEKVNQDIGNVGWSVMNIFGDPKAGGKPGFAYTIGMTGTFSHPELLMVGFRPELMHALLNGVGELVRNGDRFQEGSSSLKVIDRFPVRFRAINELRRREWARIADGIYPARFSLLQVFLPDAAGLFPWEAGCDQAMAKIQLATADGLQFN